MREQFVSQGGTSTPWSGFGDADSYRVRVVEAGVVEPGYIFRNGPVGALVFAGGPLDQEQEIDALAQRLAGLQQDRLHTALAREPSPAAARPQPTSPTATGVPPAATVVATAPDASTAYCAPSQALRFAGGFAALHDEVGDDMGMPAECEHADAVTGDTLQRTTLGLAFYRKSTNTPTFTNGSTHWALTPDGVASWTGESIDPPVVIRSATAQISSPPGFVLEAPAERS